MNPLKLEPVSKSNYSLKDVLDFATKLGLENKKNISQGIENSMQFLNLLKELLDFLDCYQKCFNELNQFIDLKESFDITKTSQFEKKIMELSKFNQHLETVMSNKQSLLMRLKDPYVGDHINIQPEHQKTFSELFSKIATSISKLSHDLENIKWFDKQDNLIDDQMESQISKKSSLIALYGNYSDMINRYREVLKNLLEGTAEKKVINNE